MKARSIRWTIGVAVALRLAAPLQGIGNEPPLPPDAGLPVVEWRDAGRHVGQVVIVQGRIVAARKTGSICFLNFDDPKVRTFTAIIREANLDEFPDAPVNLYQDKLVQIRGLVDEYNDKPQIEVFSPRQIRVLAEEAPVTSRPAARRFEGILKLASFNVLNLFDEHDDPYRADEGTPAKPRAQLEALARTLRTLDADVVALQEVENRGILERFVRGMLPEMGYESIVLYEGNDARGIDCALLSRLPVGPVTSYRHLRFADANGAAVQFQRDLLQVRIEPVGFDPLTVFVVHLKSKRGGADSSLAVREAEARSIRRILDDALSADPKARFAICGDFNDTFDSPPLRIIRGQGALGLSSFIHDLPKDAATYNIPRYRSMIDFIFASPALTACYVPASYRVMDGTVESSGSDHNPLVAEFDLSRGRNVPTTSAAAESTVPTLSTQPEGRPKGDGGDGGAATPSTQPEARTPSPAIRASNSSSVQSFSMQNSCAA